MQRGVDLRPGTMVAGRWRIERKISSGGFGITYEARDKQRNDIKVALKEFMPQGICTRDSATDAVIANAGDADIFDGALRSFKREAKELNRLRHPSIVRVSDLAEANGTAYMVLDYIDGMTLDRWFASLQRRPTQADLDDLLWPLLDALIQVHSLPIVHRDIKPSNILVRHDGTPVLIDFGAIKRVVSAHTNMGPGTENFYTPGYAAPEQMVGFGYGGKGLADKDRFGPWTDIYSLAATIYEIITGHRLKGADERLIDDDYQALASMARGRVEPGHLRPWNLLEPEWRQDFLAAIDRGLSLKRSERPQSAVEFRTELVIARPVLARPQAGAVAPPRPRVVSPQDPPANPRPLGTIDDPLGLVLADNQRLAGGPPIIPPTVDDPIDPAPGRDGPAIDSPPNKSAPRPEPVGSDIPAPSSPEARKPAVLPPTIHDPVRPEQIRHSPEVIDTPEKPKASDAGGDPYRTPPPERPPPPYRRIAIAVSAALLALITSYWLLDKVRTRQIEEEIAAAQTTLQLNQLSSKYGSRFANLIDRRRLQIEAYEQAVDQLARTEIRNADTTAQLDALLKKYGDRYAQLINERRSQILEDPATKVKPGSGQAFRDRQADGSPCSFCPEMVVAPSGRYVMGSPTSEAERYDSEKQIEITFARPFAVARFAVTFSEWDACVADGGCNRYRPHDEGWGRGSQPVINVSWNDAQAFTQWLSRKTGKTYRLLSEAEREYVTRAGTITPFWWGTTIGSHRANYYATKAYPCRKKEPVHIRNDLGLIPLSLVCVDALTGPQAENRKRTMAVDTLAANPWGLHHVHGNVHEWVEDCANPTTAIPVNGLPRRSNVCRHYQLKGGSWESTPDLLRSASRSRNEASTHRGNSIGFRVARALVQ